MSHFFRFLTLPRIAAFLAFALLAMPVAAVDANTATDDQATASSVASLAGSWQGTLDAGQVQLRLIFHVHVDEAGTISSTLDSPDQGANGIPVATVSREGDQVTFDLGAIGASFLGTLSADDTQIDGHWRQGGQSLPLVVAHHAEGTDAEDGAGD